MRDQTATNPVALGAYEVEVREHFLKGCLVGVGVPQVALDTSALIGFLCATGGADRRPCVFRPQNKRSQFTPLMQLDIRHKCSVVRRDITVRLKLADALRQPICPKCKMAISIPWWRKFQASLHGAKSGVRQGSIRSQTLKTDPEALKESADLRAFLEWFAEIAWTHKLKPSGCFLFDSKSSLSCSNDAVNQALKTLYQHARVWAPGFDVPYHIPQVRIGSLHDAVGTFRVDRDGWTRIDVTRETFQTPNAVWLTLAHEICHHILEQSGLADKLNTKRNERMTDIAMFICGFGNLVMNGHTSVRQTASGYARTHLGYLETSEYSFAHHWVIAARGNNKLRGMDGIFACYPQLAKGFAIATELDLLMKRLKELLPDERVRARLLRQYQIQNPRSSEADAVQGVIDEYLTDRR